MTTEQPWEAVRSAGGEPHLIAPQPGTARVCLRTEIRNAGGTWVDEGVHVEAGLVTSRNPGDLPASCAKLVEEVAEGRHAGQAAATSS